VRLYALPRLFDRLEIDHVVFIPLSCQDTSVSAHFLSGDTVAAARDPGEIGLSLSESRRLSVPAGMPLFVSNSGNANG
jgi:hypothetical protein